MLMPVGPLPLQVAAATVSKVKIIFQLIWSQNSFTFQSILNELWPRKDNNISCPRCPLTFFHDTALTCIVCRSVPESMKWIILQNHHWYPILIFALYTEIPSDSESSHDNIQFVHAFFFFFCRIVNHPYCKWLFFSRLGHKNTFMNHKTPTYIWQSDTFAKILTENFFFFSELVVCNEQKQYML